MSRLPNFEPLADLLDDSIDSCRRIALAYEKDAEDLAPLLRPPDAHIWAHIVHLTQIAGLASSFSRALRVPNAADPLVYACLARPAWEAAFQLQWMHTDEEVLAVRWLDYAFLKAALDTRGGKSRSVQESLLLSFAYPSPNDDKALGLVRRLCERHLTSEEVRAGLAGLTLLVEHSYSDLDVDIWYDMSDDELDNWERGRDAIDRLEPLLAFLRVLRSKVGWRYPASWTTTSVKGMLDELFVRDLDILDTTSWPEWPYEWDFNGNAADEHYATYQKLSEVAHSSGPMVMQGFVPGGERLVAGEQMIRWATEIMEGSLSRAIRTSTLS